MKRRNFIKSLSFLPFISALPVVAHASSEKLTPKYPLRSAEEFCAYLKQEAMLKEHEQT